MRAADGPVLFWSGGKDSALALAALRAAGREPRALLVTVAEGDARVGMHGVRVELVRRQAQSVRVPLVEVRVPTPCPNDVYERRIGAALGSSEEVAGAAELAFGDLFLEDIRAYRIELARRWAKTPLFPVWGEDTRGLADAFIRRGFRATLVCVDLAQLDESFLGREFDRALVEDLCERGADPCGENGEFHTFVHGAPLFGTPIPVALGATRSEAGFAYLDLIAG